MPTQDRVGSDEGDRPAVAAEHASERGENGAVVDFEARPRDLAAQDGELMAQHENLDILRPISAASQDQQVDHEPDETVETVHALILAALESRRSRRARNPRSTARTSFRHPQDRRLRDAPDQDRPGRRGTRTGCLLRVVVDVRPSGCLTLRIDDLGRYVAAMAEQVSVTREIGASAERVWAMVSDVTRMGEWSPENEGGVWLGGRDGPAARREVLGSRSEIARTRASRGCRRERVGV